MPAPGVEDDAQGEFSGDASALLLPQLFMDDDSLDNPHEAEEANGQVHEWGERFDVGSPEIWIERLRHKESPQPIGNGEPNLALKSAHLEIFA